MSAQHHGGKGSQRKCPWCAACKVWCAACKILHCCMKDAMCQADCLHAPFICYPCFPPWPVATPNNEVRAGDTSDISPCAEVATIRFLILHDTTHSLPQVADGHAFVGYKATTWLQCGAHLGRGGNCSDSCLLATGVSSVHLPTGCLVNHKHHCADGLRPFGLEGL